jgi:hypothetical protein
MAPEVEAACRNLFQIAEAYAKATGSTVKMVGKKFYGRADFFANMRAGRQTPSMSQFGKMLDKFRADWPPGVPWPFLRPIIFAPPPRRKNAGGKRPPG